LEDYETRQEQTSRRERHASTENGAGSGIGYNEDAGHPPLITSNDGSGSPHDQDMKDDQATGTGDMAAAEDHPPEPMQDTWPPNQEANNEEMSKDDDDNNNGEEVVEAAEDTVIY
jgi:hypothetical protein